MYVTYFSLLYLLQFNAKLNPVPIVSVELANLDL